MTAGPARPIRSGRAFLRASRRHLLDDYPAKIAAALAALDAEDLWWRPNARCNSIGHLVRHLAGNVRQWVVHGIGGADDERDRAAEFTAPPESLEDIRTRLDDALADAGRVLDDLSDEDLEAPRSIQGFETTVLEAVYHVVEHFSMHTGQILWIAKARAGRDLGFYEVDDEGRVIGTHW